MPVPDVLYPVNLVVEGRRCLVVGGGPVAARKVEGLIAAGAAVVVVAPQVSDPIRALGVEVVERPYRRGDLDGAWLAIVATDDPEVNRSVRADAEAARVWVNAADDPPACSFTLPAVVRQGPVMVTVSTAATAPHSPAGCGARWRPSSGRRSACWRSGCRRPGTELKAAGRSTEDVDWRPALDWDMLELIRSGHTAQARERLQACLSSS